MTRPWPPIWLQEPRFHPEPDVAPDEGEPFPGFTVDAVDRALVAKLRHSANLRDYLVGGGVLVDGELSDAGYLLFGKEPQEEYPGASLVLKLDRERHMLTGPIAGFSMRVWRTLGSRFCVSDIDQALNVVFASRDWSEEEPVHVRVWSDRVEMEFESGRSPLNERLEAAMKKFGWRLWQDNSHVTAHRRPGGFAVVEVAPRPAEIATSMRRSSPTTPPTARGSTRTGHTPPTAGTPRTGVAPKASRPTAATRSPAVTAPRQTPPPPTPAEGSWQLRIPRAERRHRVLEAMSDGEAHTRAALQRRLQWSRGTTRDVLRELVDADQLRTVAAERRDPAQRYVITSAGEKALSDDA